MSEWTRASGLSALDEDEGNGAAFSLPDRHVLWTNVNVT
jgi:hypothetical protein